MIKVFGEGRLTADPELKALTVGDKETHVAKFSLAVNEYHRSKGDKKKVVHFFDCELWDSGAETLSQYAHKGDALTFTATPRQNRWEDKTTGANRSKVIFRVEQFTIHYKRNDSAKAETSEPVTVDEGAEAPF